MSASNRPPAKKGQPSSSPHSSPAHPPEQATPAHPAQPATSRRHNSTPSATNKHSGTHPSTTKEHHGATGLAHPFVLRHGVEQLALRDRTLPDPFSCAELPPENPDDVAQDTGSCTLTLLPPPGTVNGSATDRYYPYRLVEVELHAKSPSANPYLDGPWVYAQCTLTQYAGEHPTEAKPTYRCHGFWDNGVAGNTWRIRFAPTAPGTWRIQTVSSDPDMHGCTTTVQVEAPSPADREANPLLNGFLRPNGRAWELGPDINSSLAEPVLPFIPVGDTQWAFMEEFKRDEFTGWMDALKERGLNSVMGCAWLRNITARSPDKGSDYNRTGIKPFAGAHGAEKPAAGNLKTAYFQEMDARIQYANDQGIQVGICIGGFPGNSAWWKKLFTTVADDQRWFQYIVDRYAAYNTRWLLYGEIQEGALVKNPNDGGSSDGRSPCELLDKKQTWDKMAANRIALIKTRDPYLHPIGSHSLPQVDTKSLPLVNYVDIQLDSPSSRSNTQYAEVRPHVGNKPLWVEEYWYEVSEEANKFKIPPPELGIQNTYRSFLACLGYATFGSRMRQNSLGPGKHQFVPTVAGGNVKSYLLKHDTGLIYMGHFAQFCRDLLAMGGAPESFRSLHVGDGVFAAQFGSVYAIYLEAGKRYGLSVPSASGKGVDVQAFEILSGHTLNVSVVKEPHVSLTAPARQNIAILVKAKI